MRREWVGRVSRWIWVHLVVHRCVAGLRLPCGCQVGVYETRGGQIIRLVDLQGQGCLAGAVHAQSAFLAEVTLDDGL